MPTPRKHASPAHRQRAYRQRSRLAREEELRSKGMPSAAPIPSMPSTARWRALVAMAELLLGAAQNEMQAYRDDRSEAWQESEKGEAFEQVLERLGEACECVLAIDS